MHVKFVEMSMGLCQNDMASIFDTKKQIPRYSTTFKLPNHLHLQKNEKNITLGKVSRGKTAVYLDFVQMRGTANVKS